MLFNEFKPDEKCETCGKKLIDLAEGRETCTPCSNEVDLISARRTTVGHLTQSLYCLWSFDFMGMIMEAIWSYQRMTNTGYYAEDGKYTKLLKADSNNPKSDFER